MNPNTKRKFAAIGNGIVNTLAAAHQAKIIREIEELDKQIDELFKTRDKLNASMSEEFRVPYIIKD